MSISPCNRSASIEQLWQQLALHLLPWQLSLIKLSSLAPTRTLFQQTCDPVCVSRIRWILLRERR
uniref:Uncharacterized protein n=1 Tax=Arundo donax TaxID=35708 RepID=A0A0A9BMJ0_ARUDO